MKPIQNQVMYNPHLSNIISEYAFMGPVNEHIIMSYALSLKNKKKLSSDLYNELKNNLQENILDGFSYLINKLDLIGELPSKYLGSILYKYYLTKLIEVIEFKELFVNYDEITEIINDKRLLKVILETLIEFEKEHQVMIVSRRELNILIKQIDSL